MRKLSICLGLLAVVLMTAGCQRSTGEVYEDSKTAGRHMKNSLRSLFGKDVSSRQFTSANDFTGPEEEDFIPLHDEDAYHRLVMGEGSSALPQSKESPGDPGSAIPGADGFLSPDQAGVSNVFKNIRFDTDDYTVRLREDKETIKRIVRYMKENPNTYVFVEGHCDERGPAAYNLALGSRRANAVRSLLVKEGVDLNRLFTISYGKERPLRMGHSSESWVQNRRSQFKIHRA